MADVSWRRAKTKGHFHSSNKNDDQTRKKKGKKDRLRDGKKIFKKIQDVTNEDDGNNGNGSVK